MTLLDSIYSNRGDLNMNPVSPRIVLAQDVERRKHDHNLGSVMVMSIELPKGDNRPPWDALSEVSAAMFKILHYSLLIPVKMNVSVMQPLGLFNVHKNSLSRLVSLLG